MDITPQTVNKCANFILRKLNYKFSTVIYKYSTQCHQELSEVLSVDATMLSLGNTSQCLHFQCLLTQLFYNPQYLVSQGHTVFPSLHCYMSKCKYKAYVSQILIGHRFWHYTYSLITSPSSWTRIIRHVRMLVCLVYWRLSVQYVMPLTFHLHDLVCSEHISPKYLQSICTEKKALNY